MPKQNKHHKKKNKKNQKNKQNSSPNRQRKRNNGNNNNNNNNKSKHNAKNKNNKFNKIKEVKNVKELKLKSEDISLHSDSAEITTSSPINTPIHSPIKLNYYDADISDSDGNNNFSPLSHPTSTLFDSNHAQNHKISRNPNKEMQILRSAKINHRETKQSLSDNNNNLGLLPALIKTSSNPVVSPGFNKNNSPLISQHQLGSLSPLPFPTLTRASSSPLTGYHSPTRSILRSPSSSPCNSNNTTNSTRNNSVSFGAVEIHEFKLIAGSESDGVPEDGGLSLHLDDEEINNKTIKVDEYEKERYEKWKERAKHLHWNKNKLTKAINDPEKYLFTAGREDEFYHSLTPKEREKRLSIDKKWKKLHFEQLNKEQKELNELRRSRKRNDIFCNCKPLSSMSISELKNIAQKYDIEIHQNRKIKKGFLINRIKSKVSNYRDVCCWDDIACSCVAAGIDCHSGTERKNFQCGCIKYHKKCGNKYGRYIYKTPHYDKKIINEWDQCYSNKI